MNAYQRRKERRRAVTENERALGRKLTPGEWRVATKWGYGDHPSLQECARIQDRFRREPSKRRIGK